MSHNHKNGKAGVDRRFALKRLAGIAILWSASSDVRKSLNLDAWVEESSAATLPKPAIPVIVKDTSSLYWQIVQAGARKAGEDLGVNVPELGPPSESDIAGQMRILESTLASKPAAIVIAPVEFATHDRKGEHPLRAPAHRQPDERGGRKGLPAPACCSRSRHANPIAILKRLACSRRSPLPK
jgi:hypothetical protein